MTTLARLALTTLVATILVILFGAYVRATGSGAGCGSSWPLCEGELVPTSPRTETVVEFSHRVSSAAVGLLVVAMTLLAFRRTDEGDPVRAAAVWSVVFMGLEAAIGAGLVHFELVGDDTSTVRALWMGGHLVNTFLLLGALTLTVHFARGGRPLRWRRRTWTTAALSLALFGLLLVGASGAVAALGDTLFRAETLQEALRQDLSPTAHVLVRLRAVHPVLAVGVGLFLLVLPTSLRKRGAGRTAHRLGGGIGLLVLAQIGLGALNILLMAPIWLQIVHLLVADMLWIGVVALAASVLSEPPLASESIAA